MKKSNLTISFEDEKLKALRLFAGKKDADQESELSDAVHRLYEKYVPKDARELVALMAGGDGKAKPPVTKSAPVRHPPAKLADAKSDAAGPAGPPAGGTSPASHGAGPRQG